MERDLFSLLQFLDIQKTYVGPVDGWLALR